MFNLVVCKIFIQLKYMYMNNHENKGLCTTSYRECIIQYNLNLRI